MDPVAAVIVVVVAANVGVLTFGCLVAIARGAHRPRSTSRPAPTAQAISGAHRGLRSIWRHPH